ncbi:ABC-2 type transport system permease protein [Haloactinopolyspora alba]|uniref:ABC-2 type transport system permease protein n=1 Tax=Haloactinopolyspora alba TaxID=648780 RepID=A0A2P8DYV7_9ACTN|nr:ABC transporter permease [Haloactinopolyspora alba]PSL02390.1 ABC-2 type transport system permease protein [Haloactinopolyspora alba]
MSAQPEPGPTGVIHDIGYRNYDGPRYGRQQIARALFWHSLRGVYGLGRSGRSKVLPMLLLGVMCVPAFIIAVIANVGAIGLDDLPAPYTRYAVMTQGVLTIFLAAQAPQSVSRDLRFKTIPLYFSRPLERVDYVGAKFAALTVALFALLAIPLLIMYIGALLAEFPVGEHTADVALALVGALVFAAVFAGIGLVIASMTARRGFGVAGIITVFALSFAAVSSLQGIVGEIEGDMTAAGWIGLFSPVTLVDGFQVWVLGASSSAVAGPPGAAGGVAFVLATFGVIAGCWALLMLRYRKVFAS